jgi:hypothetical protein
VVTTKLRGSTPASIVWGLRARLRTSRWVADGMDGALLLPPTPRDVDPRGVNWALRTSGATCLTRCLVQQQVRFAHGEEWDVVMGVTAPSQGFKAHAWLQRPGEPSPEPGYAEIRRLPPRPQ